MLRGKVEAGDTHLTVWALGWYFKAKGLDEFINEGNVERKEKSFMTSLKIRDPTFSSTSLK